MGVQLGFMGFNSVARSSGPVYGAAAAVRGLASSSGRLSLCFPDDEASCCGCRGPALRTARSWLTTLVVSAGHMPGPVGRPGAVASFRLRNAARPDLVVLAWSGDRSPVWGCTTTSGDRVSDTLNPHERPFTGMLDCHPRSASGLGRCSVFSLSLGGPPLCVLARVSVSGVLADDDRRRVVAAGVQGPAIRGCR